MGTPERVDTRLEPGKLPDVYIALIVLVNKASFIMKESKEKEAVVLRETPKPLLGSKKNYGTEENFLTSYWFSYDRDACILKYGKGYRMVETTLLEYDFGKITYNSKEERTALLKTFFNATNKRYVMVMLGKDAVDK